MSIGGSRKPNPGPEHIRRFDNAAVRRFTLLVLFTGAAVHEAFRGSSSFNNDVWWHLQTGVWILKNHAVPHNGLFSQHFSLPWIASSWGYDALLAAGYELFGLRAIPMLLMAFKVAIAVVAFCLALGWRGHFWTAVLLSATAQYVLVDLQAAPDSFSIILFGIELMLLLESERSGKERLLWWLPPLFAVWANLHIQFVIGLCAMAWFLFALSAEQALRWAGVNWLAARPSSLRLRTVGAVTAASFISACINPYGFHIFGVVLKTAYSGVTFRYLAEMRSMNFRRPEHYSLLLLVMLAFFALGRRRSKNIFQIGLLVAGSLLAFRIQRDAWCIVLPSIAVLAGALRDGEPSQAGQPTPVLPKWEKPLIAALVLAVFAGAATRIPRSAALMNQLAAVFPVKACDWIRENHLPPPLFNSYEWGGFVIWYLPEYPAAIDGRIGLYGDDLTSQYFKVTGGGQRLETDPTFSQAHTILLERNSGMARALTNLPALSSSYRAAYSDQLATVLVRQ